jgi:glycine dehydrogenase subunit 1
MAFVPNTEADRREMLASVGRDSVDDLFSDIPVRVRDRFRSLGLPGLSEMELVGEFERLAAANAASKLVPFLGGGIYDHYVPSVVRHLVSRSEFVTAYTPYQPEISQGTLTAMFEFQTMVCELTAMEIANASLYDGATALAEAALMAERIRGRGRIAVSRALFLHVRRVLDTYAWGSGIELVEIPYDASGRAAVDGLPEDLSALIVQSPNAFGVIESLEGLKRRVGDALLIVSTYPIALGLLKPPGDFGADIVVAEGQSLGLPMAYGGPLLGLFATRKAFLRQLPGRVAGRTVDAEGTTGYVMAAQTREQHIRRNRATSNICTNAALCALTATVYLAAVGGQGLREIALRNYESAHRLADRISALPGLKLAFDGPFFNEFVVRAEEPAAAVRARLIEAGLLVAPPEALVPLGVTDGVRIAVTEKRTDEEIDRFVEALRGAK